MRLWSSLVSVWFTVRKCGRVAQLVRAPALQAGGQGFESLRAHQYVADHGDVVLDGVCSGRRTFLL